MLGKSCNVRHLLGIYFRVVDCNDDEVLHPKDFLPDPISVSEHVMTCVIRQR